MGVGILRSAFQQDVPVFIPAFIMGDPLRSLFMPLTLGVGFLWVIIDDRREGWHDKLARTCVVYAWQARQNETLVNKMRRWLHERQAKRDAKSAG